MEAALDLIDTLAQRYQIGNDYVSAYLQFWKQDKSRSPCLSMTDIDAMHSHEKMWFDFALSANWRGRIFAEYICNNLNLSAPNKVLDIGCGFGGVLAAFSERGSHVTGIEIDPVRIVLASANLNTYSTSNQITKNDILDTHWVDNAGKFDVITCIDVIEHVSDAAATLRHIDRLLTPGGSAFLEIPNKDCLSFVRADGHFSLFGITQLPRYAAIRYHANHFSFEYDVGDYYDVSYYTNIASSLGLSVETELSPLHQFCSAEIERSLEGEINEILANFTAHQFCDKEIDPLIHSVVKCYMEQYKISSAEKHDTHKLRYLAPFWLLKMTKR